MAKKAAQLSPPVSEVTLALSGYIAHALRKRLPKEVEERGKLHLLDALAAMISGWPGARAARNWLRQDARRHERGVRTGHAHHHDGR
jgi:hypothetical protein